MNVNQPPAFDWNVPRSQENALSAPATQTEYPISANRVIIVTNTWFGRRVDSWFIWDRSSEGILDNTSQHYAFVNSALMQSECLKLAREYAWSAYKKDIALPTDPF